MDYKIITVTPFAQNCTLLICPETQRAALVDPGGEPERIMAAIKESGVQVESILLTHGHIDHIGAVAPIKRALDVPVIGPERSDAFLIDNVAEFARAFQFEPPEPFIPDRWLAEGDEISVGNQRFDVLHCPGHAPGHVVFVNHATRFIQMGDVLFKGAVGRTDLPGGDMSVLLDSITRKIMPLGDDYTFLPGHGPMSTLGEERANNPFLKQ